MKKVVEYNFRIYYDFNNSRLNNSTELLLLEATHQQPNTHTTPMKNIKINSSRKGGFSLVEMLVVIAIIGIIAAIAIPNIGNLNDSARQAAAKRNAQTVASVLNAAIAAGANVGTLTDGSSIVAKAVEGVEPSQGAFSGKNFTSGPIDAEDIKSVASYLTWDGDNKQVKYSTVPTVVTP